MAGYKGHLRGGAVAAIFLILIVVPTLPIPRTPFNVFILIISVFIGSLLPDIDHPNSMLGRYIPFISKPLYKHVGHRTLTHSIFFIFIIVLGLSLLNLDIFSFGLGCGMLSHILLDLFWPGSRGVAFLYPFYRRRIDLTPNISLKKKRKHKHKR